MSLPPGMYFISSAILRHIVSTSPQVIFTHLYRMRILDTMMIVADGQIVFSLERARFRIAEMMMRQCVSAVYSCTDIKVCCTNAFSGENIGSPLQHTESIVYFMDQILNMNLK